MRAPLDVVLFTKSNNDFFRTCRARHPRSDSTFSLSIDIQSDNLVTSPYSMPLIQKWTKPWQLNSFFSETLPNLLILHKNSELNFCSESGSAFLFKLRDESKVNVWFSPNKNQPMATQRMSNCRWSIKLKCQGLVAGAVAAELVFKFMFEIVTLKEGAICTAALPEQHHVISFDNSQSCKCRKGRKSACHLVGC